VRISDRLTDNAVCLVAAEHGPDRHLPAPDESPPKPILEVNPRHPPLTASATPTRAASPTA
jgi:molecular chaperone HtpG